MKNNGKWMMVDKAFFQDAVARQVAAEVKARVEQALRQRKEAEAKLKERKERLRMVYRQQVPGEGVAFVDIEALRTRLSGIAADTRALWLEVAQVDAIALCDAGTSADFNDIDFLLNRVSCEVAGIRNIITLSRRMA